MTISQNDIRAREGDRAMIQAATERFLAEGRQVLEVAVGASGECANPKYGYHSFTINGEKKRQLKASPKPASAKPGRCTKQASAAKSEQLKKDREALAVRLAELAAQGSTVIAAAQALGTTRNRVRKIAQEHNITIGHQAQ